MGKHKILKVIGIIILVLLILFIIHTIRNYIIISKIMEKEAGMIGKTNLSISRITYNEHSPEKINTSEIHRKDNKIISVIHQDDADIIIWNDLDTGENISLLPRSLVATKGSAMSYVVTVPMLFGTSDANNFGFKLFSAMTSIITDEKVNDQNCYCIKLNYLVSFVQNKSWINKDTGIMVKTTLGYDEIDGKKYPRYSELKDYSFDSVTDTDVSKPNLIGYTVEEVE